MNGEEQGICAAMIRSVTNLTKHSRLRSELPKLSQAPSRQSQGPDCTGQCDCLLGEQRTAFLWPFSCEKNSHFSLFQGFYYKKTDRFGLATKMVVKDNPWAGTFDSPPWLRDQVMKKQLFTGCFHRSPQVRAKGDAGPQMRAKGDSGSSNRVRLPA